MALPNYSLPLPSSEEGLTIAVLSDERGNKNHWYKVI